MPKRSQVFTCVLLILAAVSVSQAGGDKRADEKQAEIKKLQKQRLDLLVKAADLTARRWATGDVDFGRVAEAQRAVLQATVQLADTSEEKITALRELQKNAGDLVKTAERRAVGAKLGAIDLLQAEAFLLEARIELLREEAKAKPRKA